MTDEAKTDTGGAKAPAGAVKVGDVAGKGQPPKTVKRPADKMMRSAGGLPYQTKG